MGFYDLYLRVRERGRRDDQRFGRHQCIPRIRNYVSKAGWKIIYGDATVYQLPILPRRNSILLPTLELNRTVRKLLSHLTHHYFLISEKRVAA